MKLRNLVAGAALVTATVGLTPAIASASTVEPHATRHVVCVDDLYLRLHAQGVMIGLLVRGDHFDTERTSPSGAYSYGHAYGEANKDGWVQTSGLC